MKKVVLVVLLCVVFVAPAFAASELCFVQKALRGVLNTTTGIAELPVQIHKGIVNNEGLGKVVGGFCGIFRGIWQMTGRIASGAYDITTFWAADPKDNNGVGVPLDAEYAWEDGQQYNIVKDGLNPVGEKAMRGFADLLLGVTEVPGQISRGMAEGNPVVGFVKGFWYFLSREATGIEKFATFFLPNPVDTKGCNFNQEWPWSAMADMAPESKIKSKQRR